MSADFYRKTPCGIFTIGIWARLPLGFEQQKLKQSSILSHHLLSGPSHFFFNFKAAQNMKLFLTDMAEILGVCFASLCLLHVF